MSSSAPSAERSRATVPAATVLIVEDDDGIAGLLSGLLAGNGFNVRRAASGADMDVILRTDGIDLVLLDLMLPGETGTSICSRLRRSSHIPIIMLTALAEDIDRIIGLELGADDYVTKPFNSRELIARIRTVLRRGQAALAAAGVVAEYRFGGWKLNVDERQLYGKDGARITLTSAEFDLLIAFCRNPNRPLSREELLDLTRGGLAGPTDRTVDVHISRIRQKLEDDPRNPVLIKTVRLGGYQFSSAVDGQ